VNTIVTDPEPCDRCGTPNHWLTPVVEIDQRLCHQCFAGRTVVTDPERAAAEPWSWVVKVTAPGSETQTRRFGRRDQAEHFASYTRAQAAWEEL
jgi:hypothetical protein